MTHTPTLADHATVCFEHHVHRDRTYVEVCLTCLRELIGRMDDLERQIRDVRVSLEMRAS